MNLRDIFLAGAFAGGGSSGGSVSPEQIEQAVNNYLDKNPVESYTLPVGGDELGGVRNGGNVIINADGTMDAPEASGGGIDVTGASVGQIIQIASVDANGVPTAWQPVDFPTGGGGGSEEWVELLNTTLTEDTVAVIIDSGVNRGIKALKVYISTGGAGLTSGGINLAGHANAGAGINDFGSNGNHLCVIQGNVGTWAYPIFYVRAGSGTSFPLCLSSNAGVNGNTVSQVYVGGVGANNNAYNRGPWGTFRVGGNFKAGVTIMAWGVYA